MNLSGVWGWCIYMLKCRQSESLPEKSIKRTTIKNSFSSSTEEKEMQTGETMLQITGIVKTEVIFVHSLISGSAPNFQVTLQM